MNESDGPRPERRHLDAFGAIEDLDCRGRRVFLRADPFLLDALDDEVTTPAVVEAGGEPRTPTGSTPTPAPVATPASVATPTFAPGAPATTAALAADAKPSASRVTLRRLLELEARVVLGTHFTPEARAETGLDGVEALARGLSERLGVEVFLPDEAVGDAAQRVLGGSTNQLIVLPDLASARGDAEERGDEGFARALASSADAYVFEAFSASHLQYASLVKLPRLLPRRALGERARRELEALSSLFSLPRGSVGLALGGRAFADKIDTLRTWLPRVDRLCVGGAVALTLLAAAGKARAEASPEPERLAEARSLLARARDLGVAITLPVDFVVELESDRGTLVKRPADIPAKARIVDIGPESVERFSEVLGKAKHLLWWGPLGNVRHPEGSVGSGALAALCARPEIMSVAIGGDTRRFVRRLPADIRARVDLVSTGSAAARALLGGRRLPAIEAVRVRH